MANYSIFNTIKSIAAAALGVQSNDNRVNDFSHGKTSHFIIGGIIAVILFILMLVAVVSIVMPS